MNMILIIFWKNLINHTVVSGLFIVGLYLYLADPRWYELLLLEMNNDMLFFLLTSLPLYLINIGSFGVFYFIASKRSWSYSRFIFTISFYILVIDYIAMSISSLMITSKFHHLIAGEFGGFGMVIWLILNAVLLFLSGIFFGIRLLHENRKNVGIKVV